MVTLKLGSKGSDVIRLQVALNSHLKLSPRLNADGDFGNKTLAAVIQFQKSKGLTADGIVGQKTWDALENKPVVAPVSNNIPVPASTVPWMPIAESQLKVKEISDPGKEAQEIVAYHQTTTLRAKTDEVAWCSSFVNWVLIQSGRKGTNSAAAKSWLTWGSELKTPQVGAITVIKQKTAGKDQATGSTSGFHVAFFLRMSETHITLLGGNQGNRVKKSDYPLSKYDIKGYRWPL